MIRPLAGADRAPGVAPFAWGYYWRRYGPYWQRGRFIALTCVSVGFGIASRYADTRGTEHTFTLAAIIPGFLALGALMSAVMSSLLATSARQNEK